MPSSKRFRAPLVVMFGVMTAMVTFAGPASADDGVYPPPSGTEVLGATATAPQASPAIEVAGVSNELAFTGANAIGIGATGGLLLIGGTVLVLAGKRRKDNA